MQLYDTQTLLGMVSALDRPRRFIFDLFFSTAIVTFDTEEIVFDKLNASRRLAPYVSPLVAGKARTLRGAEARSFKPAYVKPKAAINPSAALKRRPGEQLTGNLSPAERFDRILIQEMEDQEAEIARREEMMAIELLRTGKIVVESPDFPKMEIDFARPAGNSVALAGGARWGQSGVKPFENIKTWAGTVHETSGSHPGLVIMGPGAANKFLADETLQKVLDNRRQSGGSMDFLGAVTGAPGTEALYLGSTGQFEFWQYQQKYQNAAGSLVDMFPTEGVLLASQGVEGYACYGAIQDVDALQAMERYPKMWNEQDPSVTMAMTQSAPLPVAARIESSLFATVHS